MVPIYLSLISPKFLEGSSVWSALSCVPLMTSFNYAIFAKLLPYYDSVRSPIHDYQTDLKSSPFLLPYNRLTGICGGCQVVAYLACSFIMHVIWAECFAGLTRLGRIQVEVLHGPSLTFRKQNKSHHVVEGN